MTPREKRKKRPRADVRKVHRQWHWIDGQPSEQTALCGGLANRLNGEGARAVPDDAFTWLPRAVQCETCLAAPWPGNWPPRIQRSGVRTHRMALEMLFATMQRLWQARLEVGHRCYVSLVPRDMIDGGGGREAAGYTFCTCDGEPKWLDARTTYCPPRLCPERAAWEAYYGMPYEQLPGQQDRRWAPSKGTIQRLLASKPQDSTP